MYSLDGLKRDLLLKPNALTAKPDVLTVAKALVNIISFQSLAIQKEFQVQQGQVQQHMLVCVLQDKDVTERFFPCPIYQSLCRRTWCLF